MIKSLKFRIYPKKSQAKLLETSLTLCRNLYNNALEERISFYKKFNKSRSKFDQNKFLPEIKTLLPEYSTIHSQVLQDTLARLDKSYKGFFRRLKTGGKAGFPRYKNRNSFNSFTYTQHGFDLQKGQIHLSKIGNIKIKQHRNIPSKLKTCTVKREASGKWFAIITFSEEVKPLPKTGKSIGIDVGIKNFAHLSDGEIISNPKFLKKESKNLAKAQRKLSALHKGTKERYKAKKIVNRIYERINNKRTNFAHQQSRKIVDEYDIICVEKLNIKNMLSKFLQYISYKAESADKKYIEVEAANTSKMCSRCGNIQSILLSDRTFTCESCKCSLDRDYNAAINILNRGLDLSNPRETRNIISEESKSLLPLGREYS
jgi:putative transposase